MPDGDLTALEKIVLVFNDGSPRREYVLNHTALTADDDSTVLIADTVYPEIHLTRG